MQYAGGKFRQGRAIADALKPYINENATYVEPFLGGANSAARIARDCRPGHMILSDIAKPLVLMHEKCYHEGVEWMPLNITREEYDWYKENKPDDPMTAWIGLGYQLTADWFHSYAPKKAVSARNGQMRCMEWLRQCGDVQFVHSSYDKLNIPDNSVVYCDPPYENSKGIRYARDFNSITFWDWVRELSQRCIVVCSTFNPPEDFKVIHNWGDTMVARNVNPDNYEIRRTENEVLIRYEGGLW